MSAVPRAWKIWLPAAATLVTVSAATAIVVANRLDDPGLDACRAIVDAHRAGQRADTAATIEALQASLDPNLRAAAEAWARYNATAPTDPLAGLSDLVTGLANAAAGCGMLGVRLPPELLTVDVAPINDA